MPRSRAPVLAAVLETAEGLHRVGVMDAATLREFDQRRLPPVESLAPAQIRQIRESHHLSQAAFARLLNTSVATVQQWELGQKQPTGAALKLLHLVQQRGQDIVL